MAKKRWRCHSCAYNNQNTECDVHNNQIFMTAQSFSCKEYEKEGADGLPEKSNVVPLLPSPQKPKLRYNAGEEVVYAFHD